MIVIVELWPFLSELFGGERTRRLVFDMEVSHGYTLEDLIRTLCERQPALSKYFVSTDKNVVCGTQKSVSAVLNDEVITAQEGFQVKLKEGDRVRLVQGFTGG